MNLRLEGSKIRGVRPGQDVALGSFALVKKESLIPRLPASPAVGFILVIRSEYGLVRLEATTKPAAVFEKMRSRVTFRLEVAFLCFLRADSFKQVEEAARAALEPHRVNAAWFDCAPDNAVAAIRVAARDLGRKLVQTSLEEADESVRRAAAWTLAARSGQLRFRHRCGRWLAASLNGLGAGLVGALLLEMSPDLHPLLAIGPCLILCVVFATVLIDQYEKSIPPV